MLHTDFSAKQYKEMTFTIMRDKFFPFMLGLVVTVSSLTVFISQFPLRVVNRFVHNVENKVASAIAIHKIIQPPAISQLNIDKILQSKTSGMSGTNQPQENKPTPTIFVENGQISATSTKRVTAKGNTYVVQEGEGLYAIAEKVYGDGMMWTVIAEANGLTSPDQIEIGMTLKIPLK